MQGQGRGSEKKAPEWFKCKHCSRVFPRLEGAVQHAKSHVATRAASPIPQPTQPKHEADQPEDMSKKRPKHEPHGEEVAEETSSSREGSGTSEQSSSGPPAKRARTQATDRKNFCEACNKGFPDAWKFSRHITSKNHQLMRASCEPTKKAELQRVERKKQTTSGRKTKKKRVSAPKRKTTAKARSNPPQTITFRCEVCRLSYPSQDMLEQHLTSHLQFSKRQVRDKILNQKERATPQSRGLSSASRNSYGVTRVNRKSRGRARQGATPPGRDEEKPNEGQRKHETEDTSVEKREGEDRKVEVERSPAGDRQDSDASDDADRGVEEPDPPELEAADGASKFECFVCGSQFASAYHLKRHLGTLIHGQSLDARSMPRLSAEMPIRLDEVLANGPPGSEGSVLGPAEAQDETTITPPNSPSVPKTKNSDGEHEPTTPEPEPLPKPASEHSPPQARSPHQEDNASELEPSCREDAVPDTIAISPLLGQAASVLQSSEGSEPVPGSPQEAQDSRSSTAEPDDLAQDAASPTTCVEQAEEASPACPTSSSPSHQIESPTSPVSRRVPKNDVCAGVERTPEKMPGQKGPEGLGDEENDIEVVFEDVRRPSALRGAVITHGGKQYVVKRVITTRGSCGLQPQPRTLALDRRLANPRGTQVARSVPQMPDSLSLRQPRQQEVIVLDDPEDREMPRPQEAVADAQPVPANEFRQEAEEGSQTSSRTGLCRVPPPEDVETLGPDIPDPSFSSPRTLTRLSLAHEVRLGSVPRDFCPSGTVAHSAQLTTVQTEGREEAPSCVGQALMAEDPGRLLFEEIQEFQETTDLHHATTEPSGGAIAALVSELEQVRTTDAVEKTHEEDGPTAMSATNGGNGTEMAGILLEVVEPSEEVRKENERSDDPLFCQLCQVRLTTRFNLSRHNRTRGHLSKLPSAPAVTTNGELTERDWRAGQEQSRPEEQTGPTHSKKQGSTEGETKKPRMRKTSSSASETSGLTCTTCGGAPFHSAYNLARHSGTELHLKRVQFDRRHPLPLNTVPDLGCRDCALSFVHRYDLSLHLASRSHQRKAGKSPGVGSEAEESSSSYSSSAYDSGTSDSSDFDEEREERKIAHGLAALDLGNSDSDLDPPSPQLT